MAWPGAPLGLMTYPCWLNIVRREAYGPIRLPAFDHLQFIVKRVCAGRRMHAALWALGRTQRALAGDIIQMLPVSSARTNPIRPPAADQPPCRKDKRP